MAGYEAPAGTIRSINVGTAEKPILRKQKYYNLKVDYGQYNFYTGTASKGFFLVEFAYYKQYLPESLVQFLPDNDVDISALGIISPTFGNKNYVLTNADIIVSSYYEKWFWTGEGEGEQIYYMFGAVEYAGWADYIEPATDKELKDDLGKNAPNALDYDYSQGDINDIQNNITAWVNKNLLPPIFGMTNCVYFPSNLGDTKSNDIKHQQPIIKTYPRNTGIINLGGKSQPSDNYYYLNNPISSGFIPITGKKDEVYIINSLIPFDGLSDRFEIISDTRYYYQGEEEGELLPDTEPKFTYIPVEYKVNQIVFLRFIEQTEANNPLLIANNKFNDYQFTGIITSVEIPDKPDIKGNITVKVLNDNNLAETEYFSARVVIVNLPISNYVQNETYCIQRYYKKNLGVGPRLGGSVLKTYSNQKEGTFDSTGIYFLYTVLKDDERLNIPYKNVNYQGDYVSVDRTIAPNTIEGLPVSHEFSDTDIGGVFEFVMPTYTFKQFSEPEEKQYIADYTSYLIKNIDDHDFEYYDNLKKACMPSSLYTFRQSNSNVDITFGQYP